MDSIEEFEQVMSECTTDGIASPLIVAIMTICGTLTSQIDIPLLATATDEAEKRGIQLNYRPDKKGSERSEREVSERSEREVSETGGRGHKKTVHNFYNCLKAVYYYTDKNGGKNKISAKVFPNGSVQITGCRNIETAHNAPNVLYEFIKSVPNSIKTPNDFRLINLRTVMINSNFNFKKSVLQERLKDEINKRMYNGEDTDLNVWRIATFQPEKYPGVNIRYLTKSVRENHKKDYFSQPLKINGQVGIFIFRSGKGTITGAKNVHEIKEAYEEITKFVNSNEKLLLF
jgi:TATA-box binding protein (TBP) (component of TFIID and TFIIIB)